MVKILKATSQRGSCAWSKLQPLHAQLNAALGEVWSEWEIPREPDAKWPNGALRQHQAYWQARGARQADIDKKTGQQGAIRVRQNPTHQ